MMRLRCLLSLLRNIFALIGVLACLFGLYGVKLMMDQYQLTPHQLAVKLVQKAGMDAPWMTELLRPAEKHPDYQQVGRIHNQLRPRILFAGVAPVERLRQRYREDSAYRDQVNGLSRASGYLPKAVAWAAGENRSSGHFALKQLQQVGVSDVSATGSYGNGLELALAYDLLGDLPQVAAEEWQTVGLKLRAFLRDALTVLDGGSASLWHGRMQLASSAWVAAVALGSDTAKDADLVSRVQAHFHESLRSIELTEGWPEGYNYWINNRAYPFALACLAHLNGVEAPAFNQRIRTVLERVGLWMIHGVEPQGRFHLFADSGPRNDLKDETQRVIDLIYLATGKPVFREYSRYLSSLHGREAYYRGYRWALPLFRGLNDAAESPDHATLAGLAPYLSKAELFGKGSFNQLFARSGWDDEATFLSFQAGDNFTHHGHYQAGHFTLNKAGESLAITSGSYGGWTDPHRLHYYLRTVAANSLLVLKPEEQVAPNRFFEINVAAGGQRIVMPTGSAITSLADWRANLGQGRHYEGATLKRYAYQPEDYVYAEADLTRAYNSSVYDENGDGGKVAAVNRQLLYLPAADILLVYDQVTATDPKYTPKWLLHSRTKPRSRTETVLQGQAKNGILETRDERLTVVGEKARLTLFPLLPKARVVRKVGGLDYRFYVETDGDDSDLDGLNMDIGAKEQTWFDNGLWRLEMQPEKAQQSVNFLVALVPRLQADAPVATPDLVEGDGVDGLVVGDKHVLFNRHQQGRNPLRYTLKADGGPQLVFGVAANRDYLLRVAGRREPLRSSDQGVLAFDLTGIPAGSSLELLEQ